MGKQAKLKALKRQAKRIALSNTTVAVQGDEQDEQWFPEQQPSSSEESTKARSLEVSASLQESLVEDSQDPLEQEKHLGIEASIATQSEILCGVAETNPNIDLDLVEASLRQTLKRYTNPRDCAGVLRNLCAVLEKKGLYLQAFEISTQMLQLVPGDTSYQVKHEHWKKLAEQCARLIDPEAEEARIQAVVRVAETAKQKAEKQKEAEHITQVTTDVGIPTISLPRTQDGLLKRTPFPSFVTMKIVSSDAKSSVKPLFNSPQEQNIYKILLELFPNYLIYPNMPLQNLFDFDQMREILNGNEFEYFLKSHVDFCITKISDYYPLIAFEVDSKYHDEEERIKKDEMKNRICCSGGLELVRLRPYGQLTVEEMRQEIGTLVQKWGYHSTISR